MPVRPETRVTPTDFDFWLRDADRRPLLMGVLNVTPDSFSDGGRYLDASVAVERARTMIAQGASVIDVGGESTRPGADPVDADEQIRRVVPAIAAIRGLPCVVSIDTTLAAVARAALDAGATMLNDVSAGRDDLMMLPLAAARGVPIALMHRAGTARTMQRDPAYADVVGEVEAFLLDRARAAISAGVAPHRVVLDVGIGFGKTLAHNLSLLNRHARFASHGHAVLLGTSRKKFLGTLTGVDDAAARVFGTAASVAWGVAHGAGLLRVHDVDEMRQVVAVIDAIRRA